jgi:hypothetical protein
VEPPRGYAFAALNLPGDRFILTYSLHLKSNLGDSAENVAMRRESVRQLLTHAKEILALYRQRGPSALLIGGDMNTSLDDPKFGPDPSLRALRLAGLHWTHEGVEFAKRTTIPADNQFPDNCFDHIFTLGLGRHTAVAKPYQKISDHYPVVLDLDVTKLDFQGEIDFAAAERELGPPRPVDPPQTIAGILNASDDAGLRAAVGQIATVRGKVSQVDSTTSGSITFIDFEGTNRRRFTAIIRREKLENIRGQFGGDLSAAVTGKTVELSGKLQLYKETPEIILTKAEQLKIVPE